MKRLDSGPLVSLLGCPDCRGDLGSVGPVWVCSACGREYHGFRNRPVLMRSDNVLFPAAAYRDTECAEEREGSGRFGWVKRMVPAKSLNLVRENMFARLAAEHDGQGKKILVVGCGNQAPQLQRHFPGLDTIFVFCDVDKHADTDVFCDSHDLPFKDGVFDGVISTAVLEHVLYPDKVVAEIHRVLRKEGFLYSEIPFLQSVHEGAYDFTRFSLSGHRRLLEGFQEQAAGMVAGPATVLLWSLVDFSRSLSSNSRVSSGLGMVARLVFGWVKYIDHWVKDHPQAMDSASCTYFYGMRRDSICTHRTIVDRYAGTGSRHS